MYEELATIYRRAGFTRLSHEMAARLPQIFKRFGREPRQICDLACGTGDAVVRLAQLGYDVIGVDMSAAMLKEARALGASARVQVQWVQADARSFQLEEEIDALTCMGNALNHLLAADDLRSTLRCVYRCLRPHGLFIFDMVTPNGLLNSEYIETPAEDLLLAWQSSHDVETGISTLVLSAFVGGADGLYRRIREVHRERAYPVGEVCALCADAGLEVLLLGDLRLNTLREDAGRFLCIAEKPED